MRQHLVDLLPDSIRTRSEAGMVIGRYITIGVGVVIVLVALSTHAHFRLESVERAYKAAEEKSRLVLAVEAEAKRLRTALNDLAFSIKQYDRIAPSLRMSDLQTLIISQVPPGVTIESMNLEVTHTQAAFDPRLPDGGKSGPKREVRGELKGFASTDIDWADLISRLDALDLLTAVNPDNSRTRVVRGKQAREFTVSFRVDLDRIYEVVYLDPPTPAPRIASGEEGGDVK